MRFIQISFIGVLSSLQGCTRETPVPQSQSESPTSLDASSLSTTISSAPNSLRSSHQSKLVPSTSKTTKIEGSGDESSHIVSPTTSSNKSDSDRINATVHNEHNQEVEKPGVSQNEIVSDVRVGQSTVPEIGIQTVRSPPPVNSITDQNNLDEQPGLGITDQVNHGEQQRSEIQNGLRSSAVHTPSGQSSVESTGYHVTDVNGDREVRMPQQGVDGSRSDHETASVRVLTDAELGRQREDLRQRMFSVRHIGEDEVISREELQMHIQDLRNILNQANRINDEINRRELDPTVAMVIPVIGINLIEIEIQSTQQRLDNSARRFGRTDPVSEGLNLTSPFGYAPLGEQQGSDHVDHTPSSSVESTLEFDSGRLLNENLVLPNGNHAEHQGVLTDEPVSLELSEQRNDIMARMMQISSISAEQETSRNSVEFQIQFVRNTIDAANRFNDEIDRRQSHDVGHITTGPIDNAQRTLVALQERMNELA